ncbi:unnamed protein product, partial [Prorocentrum cordatum]
GQLLRARARARRDARGAPWRARSRPTPPLRSSAPRRPPRRASCGGTMPAKEDKKNKKDQGFMLGPPFLAFLAMAAGMSYIFLRILFGPNFDSDGMLPMQTQSDSGATQ